MSDLIIREIQDGDEDALITLWQACNLTRPWNDPATDIAFARDKPNSQILIGLQPGKDEAPARLIASAMVGHDGHRGNMYYVAVHPDERGHGHGRAIMRAGEDWLLDKGIWAVRLMVRSGNDAVVTFYDRLGYKPSDVRVLGKWLDPSRGISEDQSGK